jgi:FkbM family methyltransferase
MFRRSVASTVANNLPLLKFVARVISTSNGFRIVSARDNWTIFKGNQGIKIAVKDLHYIQEIVGNFDFLITSVSASSHLEGSNSVVDFTKPNFHRLTGWDKFEIHFPSFPEAIQTTEQYIDLLELKPGQTILDLGAYAGMSALQFIEVVGSEGRVISVEADSKNVESLKVNFESYYKLSGQKPELIEKAMWSENKLIKFSSEGNVGSSVAEITGRSKSLREVQAITLSTLINLTKIRQVDAIKADIEGAEDQVFQDKSFFDCYKPKIVFEAILKGSRKDRYLSAIKTLESYGYSCQEHKQYGSTQTLILAEYSR